MIRFARSRLAILFVVLAASVNGCSAQDNPPPTTTAVPTATHGPLFKMNRALRIGVKTDQPGIGLADHTGGNNTGLDIDIAHEIAAALQDKPVFQSVVSPNREEMITSGAVDLVIASYSITDDRLKHVAFAGPYLIAGQDILVRKADASAYSGVDSLQDKKVCVVAASTSYQHLQDHFSKEWAEQHLVTTKLDNQPILGYQTCVDLLVASKVDAVSTDDALLAGYASQEQYQNQNQLQVVGKRFSREKYGVGLAKGNPADTALINATIQKMIEDGRWEQIVRKNLGSAAELFLKEGSIPAPPTGR